MRPLLQSKTLKRRRFCLFDSRVQLLTQLLLLSAHSEIILPLRDLRLSLNSRLARSASWSLSATHMQL